MIMTHNVFKQLQLRISTIILVLCVTLINLSYAQSDGQIQQAIDSKDYRTANKLLDQVLAKTTDRTQVYGKYLALKGDVALRQKQYNSAIEWGKKAEAIFNANPSSLASINNMITMGYAYIKLSDEESQAYGVLKLEKIGEVLSNQNPHKDFLLIGNRLLDIGNELIAAKEPGELERPMAMLFFHNATTAFEKGNDPMRAKIARTAFFDLMEKQQNADDDDDNNEKEKKSSIKEKKTTIKETPLTKKTEGTRKRNPYLEMVAEGPGKRDYSNISEADFEKLLKNLTPAQQPTAHREIAFFYMKQKQNYSKAEVHLIQAISMMKQRGELNSIGGLKAHGDLAILYVLARKYDKIPLQLSEVQRITKELNQRFTDTSTLSEDEKEALTMLGGGNSWDIDPRMSIALTAYLQQQKTTSNLEEIQRLSYNAALYLNGFVLNQVYYEREAIQKQGYPQLLKFYNDWVNQKQVIARTPVTKREAAITKGKELEEELHEKISEFPNLNIKSPDINWSQIKERLKPHQVAISYVQFSTFASSVTINKDTLYAAMIIRADSKSPDFITLGNYRHLLQLLTKSKSPSGLYRRGIGEISYDGEKIGEALYQFIWKPVEPYLKGVTQVFFSLEGLLNQVAFAALPMPETTTKTPFKDRYVGGRYKLCQLFSTAQIVHGIKPFYLNKEISSVILGDVEYTPKGSSTQKGNVKILPSEIEPTYVQSLIQQSKSEPFKPLSATRKEVDEVHNILPKSKLFVGVNASKGRILELSGHSPAILHFATHALYLRPESKRLDNTIDEALMRTALVLAGANQLWKPKNQFQIEDDGLLTAYEIANQDFSQTRLAVLSACETALGDIRGTEGVFGMQRAFKMAGVEKLIISLWEVEDIATQQFMSLFYNNLRKNQEIRDAFYNAQNDMQKQNNSPSRWAAFVLFE